MVCRALLVCVSLADSLVYDIFRSVFYTEDPQLFSVGPDIELVNCWFDARQHRVHMKAVLVVANNRIVLYRQYITQIRKTLCRLVCQNHNNQLLCVVMKES